MGGGGYYNYVFGVVLTGVHAFGDGSSVDQVALADRARQIRLQSTQRQRFQIHCCCFCVNLRVCCRLWDSSRDDIYFSQWPSLWFFVICVPPKKKTTTDKHKFEFLEIGDDDG